MASTSSSDNSAAINKRASEEQKNKNNGGDQEKQDNKPSLDPNSAESVFAPPRAPPNPIPRPATGAGVGIIRGGTGIGFNASGPFNTFSQNAGVLGSRSRPLFIADEVITTDRGIEVYAKRAPDVPEERTGSSSTGGHSHKRPTRMIDNPYLPPAASSFKHSNEKQKVVHAKNTHPPFSLFPRLICSYPNPMFPVFDPSRLTVDLPPLPMVPRRPYPPLVSNKDGSFIDLKPKGEPEEVVEDNIKEQEAQQRREVAAAESRPSIREDVVPVVRRYILPDLNFPPPPEEDEEDEED